MCLAFGENGKVMAAKITHNFWWYEFQQRKRPKLGFPNPAPAPNSLRPRIKKLVETVLQPLRDHLNVPIAIVSGYRSPEYNRKIGGARNSQHIVGNAADIKAEGIPPRELYEYILRMRRAGLLPTLGGIGLYRRWVHVDIRHDGERRLARWYGFGMRPNKGVP